MMQGVARNFLYTLALSSPAGMMLGINMAMSHQSTRNAGSCPSMVAGWLMSAVFGFFYHLFR